MNQPLRSLNPVQKLAAIALAALLLHSVVALPLPAADHQPAGNVTPGSPNSSVWSKGLARQQKAILLLNRITFGPRPGDVQRVLKTGLNNFLNQQLHPKDIDDSALDSRLTVFPTLSMTTAELVEDYPQPNQLQKKRLLAAARVGLQPASDGVMDEPTQIRVTPPSQDGAMQAASNNSMMTFPAKRAPGRPAGQWNGNQPPPVPRQVVTQLAQSELLRAVYSKRQLQEVMVQFWMNHFNIFAPKGPDKWMLTAFERDTIRPRALGNFEDLLVATAESPAMLFYLDNWVSAAPESSQPPPPTVMPAFYSARRGFFQPPSALGRARQKNKGRRSTGINENYGRELMELHTLGVNGGYTQKDVIEVARCFTGWTIRAPFRGGGFYFNPRLHDYGPKVVLGHKIPAGRGMEDGLEVLHILANHPSTARFISLELCRRFVADDPPPSLVNRASRTFLATHGDIRSVLKTILTSPEFYSQGAFRAKVKTPFELVASSLRALNAQTDASPQLVHFMAMMGEPMFQYQPPSGYPDLASTWINSGSLLARMNFALALAAGRFRGTTIDFAALAPPNDAQAPGLLIDELSVTLTGAKLPPGTRAAILKEAEDMGGAARNPQFERKRLALITSLVLASPEFQRR